MATFSQWATSYRDTGTVKKVTWVCGSERVLVEEVVDFIRTTLNVSDIDYVAMEASSTPEKEIWAAANQYPLDPTANRLILVRDAERIKRWKAMEGWLADTRLIPTIHLLFVSNEPELAREPLPQDAPKGKRGELKPHLALMQDKAHLIECKPFTANSDTKSPHYGKYTNAWAWIQKKVYCTNNTAEYLYERAAGDLGTIKNVCAKASLFSGEMTTQIVDLLTPQRAGEEFVMALCRMDKKAALLAAENIEPNDISKAIGLIDYYLEILGEINKMLHQRKTAKDIFIAFNDKPAGDDSGKKKSLGFIAAPLVPYGKHYDAPSRAQKRMALAVVDDALRSGAREGVLEAIVALW